MKNVEIENQYHLLVLSKIHSLSGKLKNRGIYNEKEQFFKIIDDLGGGLCFGADSMLKFK